MVADPVVVSALVLMLPPGLLTVSVRVAVHP
jgi:hypothetical protein